MPEKIALIGDEDTLLGFGSLGMETHRAETREQAYEIIKNIMKSDDEESGEKENSYAVILITNEVADFLKEDLERYMLQKLIMVIPSCRSRQKMGLEQITAVVEKAVGIADIMDKA